MDKETIKYRELYNVALQWLWLKEENINLSDYLRQKGVKKVVIYGMSDIGNCLLCELNVGEVEVLYTVDQGFPKLYYDVACYKLEDVRKKEKPDMVIVTIPHLFENVVSCIKEYFECEIICITELVYRAMYEE